VVPNGDQPTTQRILKIALDLFNEQGFEGTSMREVAERLGVTTAALYYHFPSKDHMLISLVRPILERTDALIASSRSAANSVDARRALLSSYLDLLLDCRDLYRFLGRDVGALNRQGIGTRMEEQERKLRTLLVGPQAKAKAHIRAMAAIGALQRPVISSLAEVELRSEREPILEAAMAVLTYHHHRGGKGAP
jgi:AcrR family transcriptional regulator